MNTRNMTMLCQYAVVELHRRDEVQKLYLRPGAYLEAHCITYVKQGWVMYSFYLCNEEEYINHRINDLMDNLNDNAQEMKHIHDRFKAKELDFETYMTTRSLIQEMNEGDLRRLYRYVNRLLWNNLNCYNQEALTVYNKVF